MPRHHTYSSDDIDVQYDVVRCIHAKECVHGAPAAFDPTRRPWVEPDATSADHMASVIQRCPTGALHYTRKDGGAEERVPDAHTVSVVADGPLYVRGDVVLMTPDGEELLRDTRLALCRCGLSKHKPFCDNSHVGAFADDGSLGTTKPIQDPDAPDALEVKLLANGPLRLAGSVTISAPDGIMLTTDKCALCRCGHSHNKPFCDGTHREIGFEAPATLPE